jgi:hypothetical protein
MQHNLASLILKQALNSVLTTQCRFNRIFYQTRCKARYFSQLYVKILAYLVIHFHHNTKFKTT